MNRQFNLKSTFFNKLSEMTECLLIDEGGEGRGDVFNGEEERELFCRLRSAFSLASIALRLATEE